jgi:hypothetical protein
MEVSQADVTDLPFKLVTARAEEIPRHQAKLQLRVRNNLLVQRHISRLVSGNCSVRISAMTPTLFSFLWFPLSSSGKFRDNISCRPQPLPSKYLPIRYTRDSQ